MPITLAIIGFIFLALQHEVLNQSNPSATNREMQVTRFWGGMAGAIGVCSFLLSGVLLGFGRAHSLKGYLSKGQVFKIIGYWKTFDEKEYLEYFVIETSLNEIILLRRRPESNDTPPVIGYWYKYDSNTFKSLPKFGTKT